MESMTDHKISEAARRTGFSVSTLRFYEKEGVVVPDRSESGYRNYRDDDIEALRFVARGKRLGLTLDQITELLGLLDEDECAPVQSRMVELVAGRIEQARDQVAELMTFTAQLQAVRAHLASNTPDGACDEDCGCTVDPGDRQERSGAIPIPLSPDGSSDVACTLDPHLVEGRLGAWMDLMSRSTARRRIPRGVRVWFDPDVDIRGLAELAAAEQSCCSFFRFDIGIGPDGITFDVTGPEEAQDVIGSVFGAVA